MRLPGSKSINNIEHITHLNLGSLIDVLYLGCKFKRRKYSVTSFKLNAYARMLASIV